MTILEFLYCQDFSRLNETLVFVRLNLRFAISCILLNDVKLWYNENDNLIKIGVDNET